MFGNSLFEIPGRSKTQDQWNPIEKGRFGRENHFGLQLHTCRVGQGSDFEIEVPTNFNLFLAFENFLDNNVHSKR